jgi:hypothetical protein
MKKGMNEGMKKGMNEGMKKGMKKGRKECEWVLQEKLLFHFFNYYLYTWLIYEAIYSK